MKDLKNEIFNVKIAQEAVNRLDPTDDAMKKGILVKQDINSPQPNGYFYKITQAIQYLQFTGGLYNKDAEYNEGNICHLLVKINKGTSPKYEIIRYRRNSSNPLVLVNNPPIKGATIEAKNGVDSYEGGTPSGDWDRMTIAYSEEHTPNTLALRGEDGSIQAFTPDSPADDVLINKKYFDKNLHLLRIIPLFYFVFPEDDGTFDDKKRPTNYYQKVFGITTVWKKRFATTGAFMRFEGGFADEARNGLLQGDAIRKLVGQVDGDFRIFAPIQNGVFLGRTVGGAGSATARGSNPENWVDGFDMDSSRTVPTGSENRPTNIKIELHELVSINGVNIWN